MTFTSDFVPKSTASRTFTVIRVSLDGYSYVPNLNSDADGDSSGTAIVVYKDGSTSAPASTASQASLPETTRIPYYDLTGLLSSQQRDKDKDKDKDKDTDNLFADNPDWLLATDPW